MSQSKPASREEHKDFCLRQLGYPVIQINVDDVQLEDNIDLSVQYFQEFHYDGTERTYLKHQITEQDISNESITLPDSIVGANRIFPVGGTNQSMGMFDLRYQLRLNDLWDLSSTSYTNYSLTMQHLATLDLIFTGQSPIRFNKINKTLYIDQSWATDVQPGEYIIVEATVIVDPAQYTAFWNDRMLKKLTTAYFKRQWGNNMKKFADMQLPGGVKMNGQQIFEEAEKEIESIEQQIRDTFQAPPQFLVG